MNTQKLKWSKGIWIIPMLMVLVLAFAGCTDDESTENETQLELLKWLPTAAQRAIVLTGCLCPITRSGRINPGNGHCRRLTALTLSTQRILPMS